MRVRWACGVLFLVSLASCGGGPQANPRRAVFQMRPVVEVVSASSPAAGSEVSAVTCEGERPQASDCLDAHSGDTVVLLEPSKTDAFVLGPVVVDGADVAEAGAVRDAATGWSVSVQLTPEGSDELAAATRMAVGDRIAILVDGRVVSAPTVQAPIGSGVLVAASGLPETDAEALAERLGGD